VLNPPSFYEEVCRHGVVFHLYFELLTTVLLYVQVLWCVSPCRLVAIYNTAKAVNHGAISPKI